MGSLTAGVLSHFSLYLSALKKAAQEGEDVIIEAGTACARRLARLFKCTLSHVSVRDDSL